MVNRHLDLEKKECLYKTLSKMTDLSEKTMDFAFAIWDFVCMQHEESHSSISISQHCDGIISVKCDDSLFYNKEHISCDKQLLHIVSIIAEHSNLEGKMHLYSPKILLNQLDFSFQRV